MRLSHTRDLIHSGILDNSGEFPTKFRWQVEVLGMGHVCIKPASPNLNGNGERSHLTDPLRRDPIAAYDQAQHFTSTGTWWPDTFF